MLASLLKQLAERQPSLPEVVKDLYNRHKPEKTRPLIDEISTTLLSLATTYVRVYLLVDALDECQTSDGSRAELLRELFALQKNCGASLFMTSRIMPNIQENFTDNAIKLEIHASEEDVGRYLDSRVDSLSKVVRSNPKLREDIKTEVFLLAELHLNSLQGKFSPKDIRRALKALPTGSTAYDETYKAAMERIGSQANTEAFAKKVLAWITCARRPFTTSELQHALAVEVGEMEFDEENLPGVDDVVAVCAGLVVVDKESNIIRLVHYTTQQYFERTQGDWFPTAEADITTACVTYLSYKTFESGPCETKSRMDERLWSHQLYGYAANNWGHHARISLSTGKKLIEFLRSNGQAEAAAEALMVMTEPWNYMEAPQRMTGLHLAAYFGMAEAMAALLTHVSYRDLKDTRGWTPLAWASMKRHGAVIKLLLENGADADSRDVYHRTPLSLTAEKGHGAIVSLLLATEGVDADPRDGTGSTPLFHAVENEHATVFNMLLTTGKVDIHAENRIRQTPAQEAVEMGHTDIVEQLLGIGKFDVNSRNGSGEMRLIRAVRRRHENLVKLLLAVDEIHVDLRDRFDRTPLSFAAEDGLEAIAKLMIDIGKADVNLKDRNNRTPLLFAAENGHEGVVRLLLGPGQAHVDARNNTGTTSFLHVIYDGHEAIARLFLATGKAGIDIPDGSDFTPLLMAAYQGHESIVRLLLETGQVDVDANDTDGRTPLLWAAMKWNEPIVRLLLEHGAKIDVRSRDGRTPLSVTSANETITKILLAAAATKKDDPSQIPAPLLAQRGHEAVVQLMLPSNMCVETNVHSSHPSPSWATEYNDMVKLQLAKARFGIDAKDQDGSTLLHYASRHGHEAIVELLLATGAVDISTTNNSNRTPLSCAVEGVHEPVVRLLVANGKTNSFTGFSQETYAALLQNESMSNLILTSFEANVDVKDSSVKPLLRVAEYEAMFRLLMATGNFDIHLRNSGSQGMT
ncbi:hypothetical protein LRP88_04661 [Fusarium phalaenopsidis]